MQDSSTTALPVPNVSTPARPVQNVSSTALPAPNVSTPARPVQNVSSTALPVPNDSTPARPVQNVSSTALPVPNVSTPARPVQNVSSTALPVPNVSTTSLPLVPGSSTSSPAPSNWTRPDVDLTLEPSEQWQQPVYPIRDACQQHVERPEYLKTERESAALRDDVFGRFRAVRDGSRPNATAQVRFVTSADSLKYNMVLPFVLSAQVAGVPLDLLGVGDKRVGTDHLAKWLYLEEFVRAAELADEDVVVMMDTDVLFTGRDPLPAVEEFLATTARSASEMDVRKIRLHQQRPPFLLSSEETCYLPQSIRGDMCSALFHLLEECRAGIIAAHNAEIVESEGERSDSRAGAAPPEAVVQGRSGLGPEAGRDGTTAHHQPQRRRWKYEDNREKKRNTHVHPNSGGVIARVWALKQVIAAIHYFFTTRFCEVMSPERHISDQSVVGLILAELMKWEVQDEQVLLGTSSDRGVRTNRSAPLEQTPPYGLTPGVMGLDYEQLMIMSAYSPRRSFLNGVDIGGADALRAVFSAAEQCLGLPEEQQSSGTTEAEPEEASGTLYRRGATELYDTSPSGVPLAPLFIVGDIRDAAGRSAPGMEVSCGAFEREATKAWTAGGTSSVFYRNASLDDVSPLGGATVSPSGDPLDVSVPLADRLPLALHFNGPTKPEMQYYSRVMPWVFPLLLEGPTSAADQSQAISNSTQRQLYALLRVMANSPPVAVWSGVAGEGEEMIFFLSTTPQYVTVERLCAGYVSGNSFL
eukprot:gene7517-biopygen5105